MVQNYSILSSNKANLPYYPHNLERLPQRVNFINRSSLMKSFWRGLRNTAGQYAWTWSVFIFGISAVWFWGLYTPYLAVYRYNNENVRCILYRELMLQHTQSKEHIKRKKKNKRDWQNNKKQHKQLLEPLKSQNRLQNKL